MNEYPLKAGYNSPPDEERPLPPDPQPRKKTKAIDTHGLKVDFGKHKGELYTRIPVSYLLWMAQSGHSKAKIAEAELKRRGTKIPEIELSAHSVDRASQRCLKEWQETRDGEEGLYSWLARVAFEAYQKGVDDQGRAEHMGMRFVYQTGKWPVVKTVQLRRDSNESENS